MASSASDFHFSSRRASGAARSSDAQDRTTSGPTLARLLKLPKVGGRPRVQGGVAGGGASSIGAKQSREGGLTTRSLYAASSPGGMVAASDRITSMADSPVVPQ